MGGNNVIAAESAELRVIGKVNAIPCTIDVTGSLDFGELDMGKIIEAKKQRVQALFSSRDVSEPSVAIRCAAPITLGLKVVPEISNGIGKQRARLPNALGQYSLELIDLKADGNFESVYPEDGRITSGRDVFFGVGMRFGLVRGPSEFSDIEFKPRVALVIDPEKIDVKKATIINTYVVLNIHYP